MAISQTEVEQAKAWRKKRNFTLDQLSELIGYSVSAIFWFERGLTPPGRDTNKSRPVNPYAWQRFRLCCEAIDRRLHSKKEWDW